MRAGRKHAVTGRAVTDGRLCVLWKGQRWDLQCVQAPESPNSSSSHTGDQNPPELLPHEPKGCSCTFSASCSPTHAPWAQHPKAGVGGSLPERPQALVSGVRTLKTQFWENAGPGKNTRFSCVRPPGEDEPPDADPGGAARSPSGAAPGWTGTPGGLLPHWW